MLCYQPRLKPITPVTLTHMFTAKHFAIYDIKTESIMVKLPPEAAVKLCISCTFVMANDSEENYFYFFIFY